MSEEQLKLLKDYQDLLTKDSPLKLEAKGESEKFLLEYELECRRSEELDNLIKSAKKDLSNTKNFLKDALEWKPNSSNIKKIENYEKKLNNIKVKYGKVHKENESLREQIQIIRRNASGAQRELIALSSNLQSIQSKTKEYQSFSEVNNKMASAHRIRIDKLNQSFTSTRGNINERVSKLEGILKKDSSSITPTGLKRPRTPYSELAENVRVLDLMLKKWTQKVKSKEKDISSYREKVYELEETLEIMRNIMNTGNFSTTVKGFIDSCEQAKDLRSNFLRISEKIENVERNLLKTNETIKKVKEGFQDKEAKKTEILEKINKEIREIQKSAQSFNTLKDLQEQQIESMSPFILNMIKKLENLGLKAESFETIEDPSLNSTNVIIHLNKLEELINFMQSGLGKKSPQKELPMRPSEKLQLNLYDIESLPIDEVTYPMTFEEIKTQARSLLANI